MGSPLSPIVANIYMEHFEKTVLDSAQIQPKLCMRYVDNNFVVWPHGRTTLNPFLDHLNSLHDAIQFTMEEECNDQIAFLDVLIKRENSVLSTMAYRKRTHTDR